MTQEEPLNVLIEAITDITSSLYTRIKGSDDISEVVTIPIIYGLLIDGLLDHHVAHNAKVLPERDSDLDELARKMLRKLLNGISDDDLERYGINSVIKREAYQ